MRSTLVALLLVTTTGCSTTALKLPFVREKTPEEIAQAAATERFAICMDKTLATFGPIRTATQDARLKAAEICSQAMKATP